jgi:hypothetical protein
MLRAHDEEGAMPKFAIAGALCMVVAGALVAHGVNTRASKGPAARAAVVSPFELMLKAKNLPVETFDTV